MWQGWDGVSQVNGLGSSSDVCMQQRERESVCVCVHWRVLKFWHQWPIICFSSRSLCYTHPPLCLLSLPVMSSLTLLSQTGVVSYFRSWLLFPPPPIDLRRHTKAPSQKPPSPTQSPRSLLELHPFPFLSFKHTFFFFFYPSPLYRLPLARCQRCPSGPPHPPLHPPSSILHPSPSFSSPATSPAPVSHLSLPGFHVK